MHKRKSRHNSKLDCSYVQCLEPRALLAVNIVFDYRFDTTRFFNESGRKSILNLAAQSYERRINDRLDAITPGGTNTWAARITHPATGNRVEVDNLRVPQDQIIVFAGSRRLPGETLAFGSTGGRSLPGTATDPNFRNAVLNRGQPGVENGTDFASWGGAITFDPSRNWHFGTTESGLESTEFDFYSTAVHELGHVLGFGLVDSWDRYVSGNTFRGPASRAANGGNVPLQGDHHWAASVESDGRSTIFAPSLPRGTRTQLTTLDWAGMQDIGWQVGARTRLSASFSPNSFAENDGSNASELRITRSGSIDFAMRTDITNSDTSELSVAGAVNFAAGESVVTIPVTARNDNEFDGNQRVTVTVSSLLADTTGTAVATVTDDEVVQLTLTASPSTINETAGAAASIGTVTRDGPLDRALRVLLASSDRSEVRVPESVVIPAEESMATFEIDAVDDSVFDRVQQAVITASASGVNSATRPVNVRDNEFPSPIDFDQDGQFEPLTDGIIGIRYIAGFTGQSLVAGAVNPDGDRTSAGQIFAGLNEIRDLLDVDLDGEIQPLTDGLLLLRFYAGFTGGTLIRNAVNSAGERTSATEIEAYLNQIRRDTDGSQGGAAGGAAFQKASDFPPVKSELKDLDDFFANF